MAGTFKEIRDATNQDMADFYKDFHQRFYQDSAFVKEISVSCVPNGETDKVKIKIFVEDKEKNKFALATGDHFSDYAEFSRLMYDIIQACQLSGLEVEMRGHKKGYEITYSDEK